MALFYDEVDKRKAMYEPAFKRSRQRYRGSRESYKVNLEISQFLFDVNNIDKKLTNFINTYVRYAAYISRGFTIDNIEYSGTESNEVMGILDMSFEIEDLKNRIIEMERKYV